MLPSSADHFFTGQTEPLPQALGCRLPATNLKERRR